MHTRVELASRLVSVLIMSQLVISGDSGGVGTTNFIAAKCVAANKAQSHFYRKHVVF